MSLGLLVSDTNLNRVVKVYAEEPHQQARTGAWVADIEIHQLIPDYFAKKNSHHRDGPLVTITKFTLFFPDEPDWKAGVIYEVPYNE